jgi:hypothetical protein
VDYPVSLHKDPWVMQRVAQALAAIRYADREGLETELDLLAFADDILSHYGVSDV